MQDEENSGDFYDRPSKSARKREATAAQGLGTRLIALKEAELLALELPETLLDAILLFPAESQPLVEAAWVAQNRGDWSSVIRRASVILERFPEQSAGYAILTYAYRCLKQYADAERFLAEGAGRFPDLAEFMVEGCWLALAQENWALADDCSASSKAQRPRPFAAASLHYPACSSIL